MFRVGQKVVYVGGGYQSTNHIPGSFGPKKGGTYTVRALLPEWIPFAQCPGVLLEEFVNPQVPWLGVMIEPAYAANNYRPAVEKKTDTGMAILRKVADDASKRRELTVCGNE